MNSRFVVHWSISVIAVLLSLITFSYAEWKEKVLYSFKGTSDGSLPVGSIVSDTSGNLYGATTQGGGGNCAPIAACGTVYELSPPSKQGGPWTEAVLNVFKGKQYEDGELPVGGLLIDAVGNLYGTTGYGGTGNCTFLGFPGGCGTVYELSPPKTKGGAWTETILYSFPDAKHGYLPNGDLMFDKQGNIYGATEFGGGKGTTCDVNYPSCGAVFELKRPAKKGAKWTETILHAFAGGRDGANPNGGLVMDGNGAIYGTTFSGGNQGCHTNFGIGCGTAFKLSPPSGNITTWAETILHRFQMPPDGDQPSAEVTLGKNGAVYSTTYRGGTRASVGTVFELVPRGNGTWREHALHNFQGGDDGSYPLGPLVFDGQHLYGTATGDGGQNRSGVVFQLTPQVGHQGWTLTPLYAFRESPDGVQPDAPLLVGGNKKFYSTTRFGGTGSACQSGCGTVFEVSP
jgi:hypothetical protein